MAIVGFIFVVFVSVHLVSGGWTVNIAFRKPVSMSSVHQTFGPQKAVDGNTTAKWPDGIIDTGVGYDNAWWRVDLETVVERAMVEVYFRTDYTNRRNGVQLYTSTTPFSSSYRGQLCYSVTGSADGSNINSTLSVTCPGRWRFLMLYTNTNNDNQGPVLDFGEVRVLVCSTGTYGATCDKTCSSRQCAVTTTSCYSYTGECLPGGCMPGWIGRDCIRQCSSSRYGVNCSNLCDSRQCAVIPTSCDHITGICPGGCLPGWMGVDCKTVCGDGTYGLECGSVCTGRKCLMESTCHHVTGQCVGGCKPGWNGTDCKQKCPGGRYGSNCSKSCTDRYCMMNPDTCDHVTGNCSKGCRSGWMGMDCTKECAEGTYSLSCQKSCSDRHCRTSSSSCDRETGQCPDECGDGWMGEDCTIQCSAATFAAGTSCMPCSIRHCQGQSDCPGDGTCSGGCQDGWTQDNCTQACPGGSYGGGCNSTCGRCANNDVCDPVGGDCPSGCQAGWKPGTCKDACTDNMYGVNCESKCGMCIGTCNTVNGSCPGGCREGYNGTLCNIPPQKMGKDKSADTLIPVVAGTAAALLIIIIIIVAVIVYRRRRKSLVEKEELQSNVRSNNSSEDKPIHRQGDNVYVNVEPIKESTRKKKAPPLHDTPEVTPPTQKPQPQVIDNPKVEEELPDEDVLPVNRDYYNDSAAVIRKIPVEELADTVLKILSKKEGFEAEYSHLPTGFSASYADSQKPENTGKNKYIGYYPYDHNRVRLSLLLDIPGSDYINASLMHSYNQRKAYIAAQAPNKKTLGGFWRMIWEHRCGRILMLTGLVENKRVKCYQYWSDNGNLETDHFCVEVKITDPRANYTVRHMKVTSKESGECRSVVQYHFTSWPDHGVPDTLALVHFIWMIRQTDTRTVDGPLLIHCSAGVGRTGTYIAVDSLLDQARREGLVDVLGYVSIMRGQRKNMIQTKEQYECVFHCLVEMTKFGNTSMDVENFTTSYISRGMDSMVDRKTLREITQLTINEEQIDNRNLDRIWIDGNNDFIVRVGPTLTQRRGYLMSVVPPLGLEKLLWKLVKERDVHDVIVISRLQKNIVGETGGTNNYDGITVKTTGQTNLTSELTQVSLQLQTEGSGNFQTVKLFKLGCSPTLDDMSSCLLRHAHLQNISKELTPVVVVHSETDQKLAVLFCIMGNIISGILQDRRVDVIGYVRTFLKRCSNVIITEQELVHLHDFAKECVQLTANTYDNL